MSPHRRRAPGLRRLVRPVLGGLLAGVCWAAAAPPATAVETRFVLEPPASLADGSASGVAWTSRGRLFLAPRLSRLGEAARRRDPGVVPPHVWSMTADGSGNVYLGTGPEGRIFRVTPDGGIATLFTVDEPMVTALAVLPGGDLLAGASPEGRIYRVAPDGRGAVWAETGERYVWSLVVAPDGLVFAGTGENGVVFRIDRSGEASPFFDSDEAHVVSLAPAGDGGLLAGGAGRGLVYRIDREGHGLVLHDDELPEVTGIVAEPDGSVVAALLAPADTEPPRPAVKIQLPGAAAGTTATVVVEEPEERGGPLLEGVIEGLPLPAPGADGVTRGRVVRIGIDGVVESLWSSTTDAPFCLALARGGGRDRERSIFFGTGEPGRIYRVEPDGDVALLATLREGQVSAVLDAGRFVAAATSNPGAVYRLDRDEPDTGEFLSRPLDSGGPARWGSIGWEQEGEPGAVELYTRTGNSRVPDATWSAWSPALTRPARSPIVNPDGRYLQWRARLAGGRERPARISGVRVSYAPYNRPPALRELRVEDAPAGAVAERAVLRWSSSDPDGDPVRVEVQYRPRGGGAWRSAVVAEPQAPARTAAPDSWVAGRAEWDTSSVGEGSYELRAVASDHGANHPGEGREISLPAGRPLDVDRTPPAIGVERRSDGTLEIEVTDDRAGVARLELRQGGRVRFTARPLDGVCDAPREKFVVRGSELSGDGWSLRAVDSAGNATERPTG